MTSKMLFHEDTNKDISDILVIMKKAGSRAVTNFHNALIEAYQLIYENPNTGESIYLKDESGMSFRNEVKALYLQQFDCAIIFKKISNGSLVVLGIKSLHKGFIAPPFPFNRSSTK